MYKALSFDISGKCNAICPWCYTGRKNVASNKQSGEFITPAVFEKAIKYMLDNSIMNKSSIIHLYNWGEPFLNPYLKDIINILNKYEIKYGLSTNASIIVSFAEEDFLRNLSYIAFSMPGFSQNSYNKIHGFNFEKIKNNIITIVNNFRKFGFEGEAQVSYHVYQFNLSEVEDAYKFARENDIAFYPVYAYINDHSVLKKYLKSQLTYQEIKKASKELILFYLENKIKEKPKNYRCPQFEMLTIDEHCNILTCCSVDKEYDEYSLGSLFSLSLQEIQELKLTREICKECDVLGLNYIIHNAQRLTNYQDKFQYTKLILQMIFNDSAGRNIGIYGTGKHTDKMLQMYQELFGPFKCNLFFFDPSEEKWGKIYHNSIIHSPRDIDKYCLERVIISSFTYQDEIYTRIKDVEKSGIKIVKIYNRNDEFLF
jgi:MoaA/NifB/PqqE/SkfB family radical SAM enzyme